MKAAQEQQSRTLWELFYRSGNKARAYAANRGREGHKYAQDWPNAFSAHQTLNNPQCNSLCLILLGICILSGTFWYPTIRSLHRYTWSGLPKAICSVAETRIQVENVVCEIGVGQLTQLQLQSRHLHTTHSLLLPIYTQPLPIFATTVSKRISYLWYPLTYIPIYRPGVRTLVRDLVHPPTSCSPKVPLLLVEVDNMNFGPWIWTTPLRVKCPLSFAPFFSPSTPLLLSSYLTCLLGVSGFEYPR